MERGAWAGGGWREGDGGRRRKRGREGKMKKEGRGRRWQEWRLRTEEWMEGREDGRRRKMKRRSHAELRERGEYVAMKRRKRKREEEKKRGEGHSER